MMKRLWFLLSLLLLAGCASLKKQEWGKTETAEQKKQDSLDPYAWDFGRIREGEILEHAFTLKNDTQKTLNIKSVNTSCGCAVSEIKNKIILPGESTLIVVRFDTKRYSGATQQFIYVHTDNLDKPILKFIIKAEVVK